MYARWFRWLLSFVVPLACVSYYPGLAVLGRPDPLGAPAWWGWVSPAAGFGFLALSFAAWRVGVRRYASTAVSRRFQPASAHGAASRTC